MTVRRFCMLYASSSDLTKLTPELVQQLEQMVDQIHGLRERIRVLFETQNSQPIPTVREQMLAALHLPKEQDKPVQGDWMHVSPNLWCALDLQFMQRLIDMCLCDNAILSEAIRILDLVQNGITISNKDAFLLLEQLCCRRLPGPVLAQPTTFLELDLTGGYFPGGLHLTGSQVAGNLTLNHVNTNDGQINLDDMKIGGRLKMRSVVSGNVFFRNGEARSITVADHKGKSNLLQAGGAKSKIFLTGTKVTDTEAENAQNIDSSVEVRDGRTN